MRKNPLIITAILTAFLFCFSSAKADHLDGLWRNDRQNITLRVEQEDNAIRTKRIDQGVWYSYRLQDDNVYVDRSGNWYEVLDENELEWNESRTNKRIIFRRVNSTGNGRWDDRANTRENVDPWKRTNRDEWDRNDRSMIEGRWYDRSNKERLLIEAVSGGYRIKTQHGAWEKYTADRRGERLRSRSGNIIQMLDRNTIRWQSDRGRHERIFIRQGNGHHNIKDREKHNRGHQSDHRGKHSCG